MTYHDIFTGEQLSGFGVVVTDVPFEEAGEGDLQECGQYDRPTVDSEVITVACDTPLNGRYVYVYKPGTDRLVVCEVTPVVAGKNGILDYLTASYAQPDCLGQI